MHTSLIFSSVHTQKKKKDHFLHHSEGWVFIRQSTKRGQTKKSSRDKRLSLNDGHSRNREPLLFYRNPAAQQSLCSERGSHWLPNRSGILSLCPLGGRIRMVWQGVAQEMGHWNDLLTPSTETAHHCPIYNNCFQANEKKKINSQIAMV